MRGMRYLISRQWSVLQDFDITGESGDLRYQVRGNLGLAQSLTITEPAGQRWAQITRTPFTTRHQVIIDGRQAAQVRHQFLGWNNCTIDSASGQFVAQGSFLGWQYTISQENESSRPCRSRASCPPPSRSTRPTGRTICSCYAWSWRSSRSTGSANGAERRPGIRLPASSDGARTDLRRQWCARGSAAVSPGIGSSTSYLASSPSRLRG
jgi:uncharacterized protein YxjI